MKSWMTAIALLGMGALCMPAFGSVRPGPGTLSYFEGSASLSGRQLQRQNVGSANLRPGQVLSTGIGRASVLLMPGTHLRVAKDSSVKMVSSGISSVRVQLLNGEAGIEVDRASSNHAVAVLDNGVTTDLAQRGFYEFFASNPRVMVFTGQAQVEVRPGKFKAVGKNHEMALVHGYERAHGFRASRARDALFQWSKARHDYLASNRSAREYAGAGPGWGWSPYGYSFWGGPYWSWGPAWGYYPGWWGGYWGGGLFGPYFPGSWGGGYYVLPQHHEPDSDNGAQPNNHGDFNGGSGQEQARPSH